MKRSIVNIGILAALAALALSCSKETDLPEGNPGENPVAGGFVFTASTDSALGKTTVENGEGDERIVKWASGDEIAVYWDGGNTTATAGAAGTSTTFTPAATPGADMYYAAYPASVASAFSEGALTVTIPATQDGSFANANIAVAKTTDLDRDFQFTNLTALVKFTVSGSYTKAVFRGAKGETLAGTVPVTFAPAATVGTVSSPVKEVEVTLSGAGEYYISVLPVTLEAGFSISLYNGDATSPAAYLPVEVALERATITNLGAIDGRSISNYFVTPDGAGKKNGRTWENALGTAELRNLIKQDVDKMAYQASLLDGVTIHMAAGDYFLAGESEGFVELAFADYSKPVEIAFKGGYPANLTGTDTSAARDTTVTAFTGTSGSVTAKIFMIKDNANISFDGITFKNSVTSDSEHAAIGINSSTATVTISRCSFKDNSNSNTGQTGAAITLIDGILTVTNCTFTGNKARNAGALFLKDEGSRAVRVSNCMFKDNTSTNTSGAVQNAKHTNVQFSHCVFINNIANSFGGGAFHTSTGASTVMEDCLFQENKASATGNNGRGGAVSIENSGEVILTRCKFNGNVANCGDKTLAGESNSTVSNNVGGGAIILRHDASKVTLNNCSFTGNSAPNGCGGAIGAQKAGSSITINEGTTFNGNSSYFQGGAVFTLGNLTIQGSATNRVQFSGNSTLHETRNYSQGGAVWVGGNTSVSTIRYVLFTGNDAGVDSPDGYSSGGAIRASAAKKVTVEQCEFTGNRGCNGNGFSYSLCVEECVFADCNFHDNIGMSGVNKDGNASRFYGGAGEITSSTVSFERCTFKDNLARSHSGVVHFNNSGNSTPTVHFTDCLFDGNKCYSRSNAGDDTVTNNGGGCFKCTDGMKMTFNRCIFKNNSSPSRGAIQLGHDDVLFMNQVAFENNQVTATGSVWGVNVHSGKSVICMNNVTSFNNSAPKAGTHYAFNTDGGVIITNSTFVDNCTTGVVRANNTSGNGTRKSVFCNSIFINRKTANNVMAISSALTSAGHNLLSSSSAPSNLTLDSSDKNSVTGLTSGSYSANGYLGYYSWTNDLSGFTAATSTIVTDAIESDTESVGSVSSNIGQDFYDWLSGLGALDKDGRGVARTGTWWPGAYQN